jgi:membrane associated rhomboid family serine protease
VIVAHQQPPKRRSAKFCLLMMFLSVVGFVIEMWFNGWEFESLDLNPSVGPSATTMIRLGAKDSLLMRRDGEWWRLVTPMFLHAGLLHLIGNMIGLHQIGTSLELEYGARVVGPIYVLSGILATAVSAICLPGVVSVGASGSICGLLGAHWALLIQERCLRDTCAGCSCGLLGLLLTTAFIFAIGLLPFVDQFMHLAGMVGGLMTGVVLLGRGGSLLSYRYLEATNEAPLLLQAARESGDMWEEAPRGCCDGACCLILKRCTRVNLAIVAGLLYLAFLGSCLLALFLPDKAQFDASQCEWCKQINCYPTEWWRCASDTAPEWM